MKTGTGLPIGEIARFVAQVRKALLNMHWHRIIHLSTNTMILQVDLQLISLRHANDVLVEDMPVHSNLRQGDIRFSTASFRQSGRDKKAVVSFCVPLTASRATVQMGELRRDNNRL